jgi:hypothetical protein
MNKSAFRHYLKERRLEEIEPSTSVKTKLDEALKAKRKRLQVVQLPFYQTVAAAVLCMFAGAGIGQLFDRPPMVVERIVQQVKMVDRPVKEIQYIRVPEAMAAKKEESLKKDSLPNLKVYGSGENDLAVADVQRGISMGDDTLLQKMMVTIY